MQAGNQRRSIGEWRSLQIWILDVLVWSHEWAICRGPCVRQGPRALARRTREAHGWYEIILDLGWRRRHHSASPGWRGRLSLWQTSWDQERIRHVSHPLWRMDNSRGEVADVAGRIPVLRLAQGVVSSFLSLNKCVNLISIWKSGGWETDAAEWAAVGMLI